MSAYAYAHVKVWTSPNKDVSDALIIKPRQLRLQFCRRVDSNIWRESDDIHTFTIALCFSSFLIASHCDFLLASPFCGGSRGVYRGARSASKFKTRMRHYNTLNKLGPISEDLNFRNCLGKDAPVAPPTEDRLWQSLSRIASSAAVIRVVTQRVTTLITAAK